MFDSNPAVAEFFERPPLRSSWFWNGLFMACCVTAMAAIVAWRRWPLQDDLFGFLKLAAVPVLVIAEFVSSVSQYSDLKGLADWRTIEPHQPLFIAAEGAVRSAKRRTLVTGFVAAAALSALR